MSQEKVTRYKEEKANRKKVNARRKVINNIVKCVVVLVILGLIAWAGISIYNKYQENQPLDTYYADVTDLRDYISGLNEE